PVHQGARPVQRARGDQRDQGRPQVAGREPVRKHRAHDGRARRAGQSPAPIAERRHERVRHRVMKSGSLLRRMMRLTTLPTRVGQRIGLFDYIPEGLPPGATSPRHTFRWDLDKTYLRTEFDSIADLARSAIENAADKQAYPGATALLRALRQDGHRICIVSGSPTQMRQVLA